MSNFKKGQKVVCIFQFSNNPKPIDKITLPEKDKIYTVREVIRRENRVGILLEEIVNKPLNHKHGFGEQGFVVEGFRPLKYDNISAEILEKFKITEEKSEIGVKETQPEKKRGI